jgi:hypothetical protein
VKISDLDSDDPDKFFAAFEGVLKVLQADYKRCTEEVSSLNKYVQVWRSQVDASLMPNQIRFFLNDFFYVFLNVFDECLLLWTGSIRRVHHQKRCKSLVHNRGKEQIYFKNSLGLTASSCDGLQYEYKKWKSKRIGKIKQSSLATLDTLRVDIEQAMSDCKSCAEEVLEHIKSLGTKKTKIKSSLIPYVESIKIEFISLADASISFEVFITIRCYP